MEYGHSTLIDDLKIHSTLIAVHTTFVDEHSPLVGSFKHQPTVDDGHTTLVDGSHGSLEDLLLCLIT